MPKRKAPMTVAQVSKLGTGNHRVGGVPGLVLQVNKSGEGRSYTLRYTDEAGRRREVGIGSAHVITLQQARDKGLEIHQRLRLAGEDPIAAREARRLQAQADVSFGEAVTAFLKSREGTWGSAKHAGQWATTLDRYALPVLGRLPVASIMPSHVAQALGPIWISMHQTAARTRQRVETVLAYADALAHRQRPNPARLKGNLDQLLPKVDKVDNHHAALRWQDMPEFMDRLKSAGGTGARALQFLILTAARSGEVRGAAADELDGSTSTWTVPADRMKAGKAHQVPLSTQALALVPGPFRHGELLFPGRDGGQMSDQTLSAVLKRLGVDTTVHGFRSSFRDWCADHGHDRLLAEAALAHAVGNATEAAYARSTLLERRRTLMQAWGDYLGV